MAVDVGNTQTVLGLFEGEDLRGRWRLATEAHRTADELAAVSDSLLGLRGLKLADVSAVIVSSVVPVLTGAYRHLTEELLGVPFYQVEAGLKTGLENRYDDPAAVGADRIVNSVAVGRYHRFPAIIIDFGTATTVCAVDGDSAYRGGAILPGLYVSLEALVSRTAKLPSVDLEESPPRAIGTNTPDSIVSGFVYGYAGAVDALIRRFKEELAAEDTENRWAEPRVIATGGPSPTIVRHCREICTLDPDLTLKGLLVLHELNA